MLRPPARGGRPLRRDAAEVRRRRVGRVLRRRRARAARGRGGRRDAGRAARGRRDRDRGRPGRAPHDRGCPQRPVRLLPGRRIAPRARARGPGGVRRRRRRTAGALRRDRGLGRDRVRAPRVGPRRDARHRPPAARGAGRTRPAAPAARRAPPARSEVLVPVALREVLAAGEGASEHRRVTVAFLAYGGFDAVLTGSGPAVAARRLHELVAGVQEVVDARGLCFLGTDLAADGGKILLTAGAPVSCGGDEEQMLLALREILDRGTPLPVRIGVNAGPVFAGVIGTRSRRTYTVMGDAVNLAARVMGRAGARIRRRHERGARRVPHPVRDAPARALHGEGQAAPGRGGRGRPTARCAARGRRRRPAARRPRPRARDAAGRRPGRARARRARSSRSSAKRAPARAGSWPRSSAGSTGCPCTAWAAASTSVPPPTSRSGS
ncbi:MAG: hypothetical protein KatS3mg009_0171 [Acidimicrobiia bacterium]|nr:MAG: hypothetical protein KatS3mg009_0171 [Acidimicrobiia bacterium]